jgi:methyl coenzyme M reductase alpha subunit
LEEGYLIAVSHPNCRRNEIIAEAKRIAEELGIEIKEVMLNSPEGEEYVEKLEIRYIPAFIVGDKVYYLEKVDKETMLRIKEELK